MRLYRIPHSTNVERVALALAYKGLAAESVWIDPGDRSEVERVSGQPLVPVLDDDGTTVADSTAILEYLEERFPDPPLYPRDPARRAQTQIVIDWFNRVWKGPPNQIEAELGKAAPDGEWIEALGQQITAWLDVFEALLSGREYLMGEFSAADCVAFPFLKYAAGVRPAEDDELFHVILERYQPLGDAHPNLEAWIRRVDERPRV